MTDSIVVLVVEDDPLIQVVVEDALRDGGYDPTVVASGEEAAKLLRENTGTYRAVILDINLKGAMEGWETARIARNIDPALPVVFMSGGSAEQWASQGVPNSIMLPKPFAPAQLVTAVSQLLNGASRPDTAT
jgi:DNA-binding response OmpR family regulator